MEDNQYLEFVRLTQYLTSKGIYSIKQIEELLEPNFFAVIPIDILEKKTISANAKILFAEIMALSKKSGKCFATNQYLADRLGLSGTSIPRLLAELKDDCLIKVEIKRDNEGTFRDIYIQQVGSCSSTSRGMAKLQGHNRNRQIEIDNKNKEIKNKEKINTLKEHIRELAKKKELK